MADHFKIMILVLEGRSYGEIVEAVGCSRRDVSVVKKTVAARGITPGVAESMPLIASQSGPGYWVQALPDRVAADSIVNRLANQARTINLGSIDMRRLRADQARADKNHWE